MFGVSCSTRSEALSNAIYNQEEVVSQLSSASEDIRNVGNTELTARLRGEPKAVSNPGVGLGEFEYERDIAELDMPVLAERVQKAAPELWDLLAGPMEQQRASRRDTLMEYQGYMVMVCSIIAHSRASRKSKNFSMLLGLHLHSRGVKRRTINVLAGLGVTSSYKAIISRNGELADIGKKLITSLANDHRNKVIIPWDSFDYNQNVHHQALREPAKHISATTEKLCIGHHMPSGGLHMSVLRPETALAPCDIYLAPGNQEDEILRVCQRFWIAEAIRYTHREAVEEMFTDHNLEQTRKRIILNNWSEIPSIERLPPR